MFQGEVESEMTVDSLIDLGFDGVNQDGKGNSGSPGGPGSGGAGASGGEGGSGGASGGGGGGGVSTDYLPPKPGFIPPDTIPPYNVSRSTFIAIFNSFQQAKESYMCIQFSKLYLTITFAISE